MHVEELTATECYAKLASAGFGRLACARDNQPYVVPTHFAVDGDAIYAFSAQGQKIDWMRENPRVCLETDWVNSAEDWASVVVVGRYEELADTPEHYNARLQALAILQNRPMWWEPGAIAYPNEPAPSSFAPVFYRIVVDRISGFRGVPSSEARPPAKTTLVSDFVELGTTLRRAR